MLSQILVSNIGRRGVTPITLYVHPPEKGFGCVVRGIDGLGPVQSEIRSVSYAELDGGSAASPRVGVRSVTVRLGFTSNYTLGVTKEDVRRELYQSILPSDKVRLTLIESEHFYKHLDTQENLTLEGYVETLEPNVWTRDPETTLTILCPDPNIYLPKVTHEWLSGQELTIFNQGNHAVGFDLFSYSRYSNSFTIENLGSGEKLEINHTFDPTEKLRLSTVEGRKRLEVLSSDDKVTRRLWDSYSITRGWPKIYPGQNRILIDHNHHVEVDGELSYFPTFRGV